MRQKTFSAVFSDKRFDESRYIDEIIASTGVCNRRIEPLPEDLWNDIDHLVYMQDEPFGSLSIYAQYRVMRIARHEVKKCWMVRVLMSPLPVISPTKVVISAVFCKISTGWSHFMKYSAVSGITRV